MINLMHSFLEKATLSHASKNAVVTSDNMMYSFEDIHLKSNSLAQFLLQSGIEKGDRIVSQMGNSVETIISFWAVLKVGAVIVPIGTELKKDKLIYVLKDSGAKIWITDSLRDIDNDAFSSTSLERILFSGKNLPKHNSLEIVDFQKTIKDPSTSLHLNYRMLDMDLAAIIYTSGSTGEPKGVVHTHRSMITATNSLNEYLKYNETDNVLCVLPLSFDYGLYQMIMSISVGATLLLEQEQTWPIFLLRKIKSHHVTIIPVVPTLVMMLFEQQSRYNLDLSSVRAVTNTGAALTEKNIAMTQFLFPQADIFSMYGLTECKRCSYLPPKDIDRKPKSVGIAIPNTEIWLIDAADNRITEPNQVGQLVVRGSTVMQGYWNKPIQTAKKLRSGLYPNERVFYSGDLCKMDEEGYLYFVGRMDEVIKSRGVKVSPKEVEDFISKIPEVVASAIIGVDHEEYGEVLCAFVVLSKEGIISEKELISQCSNGLEPYKVPYYLYIIKSIPKTPNGKFNKLKLKELASDNVLKAELTEQEVDVE